MAEIGLATSRQGRTGNSFVNLVEPLRHMVSGVGETFAARLFTKEVFDSSTTH